jgi:hypothetical protein
MQSKYLKSIVLFKSTKIILFILTTVFTVLNLIMSGSPLVATDYIVVATADTGISNSTNVTASKPTGNYTNTTALVTEGPRQIIQNANIRDIRHL